MIVGFDFGTTNSLISFVSGERVIDVLDDVDDRPYPSVVRYEGEEVIVGREARAALEEVGIGVHGSTVRSPKFKLGEEVIAVGGVDRSPIDIVAHVIRHVRTESLASVRGDELGTLDRAVVTIPVSMNGPKRAALREAFSRADMSIVQFVHEPLAALYGYMRGARDSESLARELLRRNVLVVDWGGGTLDLTLCRIEGNRIVQVKNGGNDQVGGDKFDHVLRDEVVKRFSLANGIAPDDRPAAENRMQLLQRAEMNKMSLSTNASVHFYRPNYFTGSGTDLEYQLTRTEFDEIARPLVDQGILEIETLLDTVGMAPTQVSLCLVAGGMAAMPGIKSRLYELFGPERVVVPDNSATLISQGAAWIAHDAERLVLAKRIELELARGSLMPLLSAGTRMPAEGDARRETHHLFCTDPTDGKVKFSLVTPQRVDGDPQATDPRLALGVVTIAVDEKAPPLHERLELDITIDDDLILTLEAQSSRAKDRDLARYFDLEFGIGFPGAGDPDPKGIEVTSAVVTGGLVLRANVTNNQRDRAAIPGDILHAHDSRAFDAYNRSKFTETQLTEHLYYQPCSVCKRQWGHCSCATGG